MAFAQGRLCSGCGVRYDVLVFPDGAVLGLDNAEDTDESSDCPGCDSVEHKVLIATRASDSSVGDSRWYPRFDRGLGITLTSEQHRRQVCKERGLIPYDGDGDPTAGYREIEAEREASKARRKAEEDYLETSSAAEAVEYRRLRGRGFFDDQMAEIRRQAGG